VSATTAPAPASTVGPFTPEATTCERLEVGDFALFDAAFGVERIVEVHVHTVGSELPSYEAPHVIAGGGDWWKFLRLAVEGHAFDAERPIRRYVFRGTVEPVTRWNPAAPLRDRKIAH
jgi:hypothetical protein